MEITIKSLIMAKIRLSGILSDISGKVGGSIFQHSQSGYILRNLSIPVNKKTDAQLLIRNIASRLQYHWINLTQEERDIWDTFTHYNSLKQKNLYGLLLNSHQVFFKVNHYRLLYNYDILVTPQFIKYERKPIDLTLILTAGKLRIISNRELIFKYEFLIIFLTSVKRASINNPGSSHRAIIGDFSEVYQNDITDAYFSVFGMVPEHGQTVFFKFTSASKQSGLLKPFNLKKVTL